MLCTGLMTAISCSRAINRFSWPSNSSRLGLVAKKASYSAYMMGQGVSFSHHWP